ncbi:MAG: sigma-70 family RNA polymerase sigma factor [Caldilineaceae bacterium]
MLHHRHAHLNSEPLQPQMTVAQRCQSSSSQAASPGATADCWQLWLDQQPHFYRLCRRWLHNHESDVDDAFNRAAVLVWRKQQENAQPIANPMGWLTGLLRHVCLDLHRARQRAACRAVELDAVVESATPSHRTFANDSPETILLRREKYAYLSQAIDALPSRLRTVIILRFYQEQSCEEIATRLHLSVDNVYKRVQEARTLLLHKVQLYQAGLEGPAPDAPPLDDLYEEPTLPPAPQADKAVDSLRPRVTVLPHVSKREEQKLQTLRAYVARHPTGWKKRLELADQLCKMNELAEALAMYEQVLAKQPQLMNARLQMTYIYEALGQGDTHCC